MLTFISSNAGVAISRAQFKEHSLRVQKTALAVQSFMRHSLPPPSSDQSSPGGLSELMRSVITTAYEILPVESASIYICDQVFQESWVVFSKDQASDDLVRGLTVPFDQGVVGRVARTGFDY